MTYRQAQSRAYWYTGLSWALLGLTFFMIVLAVIKSVYYSVQEQFCTNLQEVCYKARSIIGEIYNYGIINPVRWFWKLFPDVPFPLWFESLLSPAGATVIFLFGYSIYLGRKGYQLRTDVIAVRRDAQIRSIRDTYEGSGGSSNSSTQTTGSMYVGGDVSIHQVMNNDPRIKDADKGFFKTPLGLILTPIVCSVLSIIIGQIILNSFGLAH